MVSHIVTSSVLFLIPWASATFSFVSTLSAPMAFRAFIFVLWDFDIMLLQSKFSQQIPCDFPVGSASKFGLLTEEHRQSIRV